MHAHPRNLTDRQIAEIRVRGGLVGQNLCADQLGEQTFDGIARHLDHYLSLDGGHTVALGCDLDGTGLPDGWGGIEVMERLYEALARQNVAQDVLDRVFFSNCVDFFASALTKGGTMR
ncbi:MAG: membrane dipeptidase [Acutalibacteraceae bacterium]